MDAGSLVWFLIVVAIFGLIVGAVGRLLVPGPTPLGVLGTMAAGIAGAFIGGFVGRLLLGPGMTPVWAWLLSILGAALVVWLVSRRGRSHHGYEHEYGGVGSRWRGVSDRSYGYDAPVVVHEDGPYRPVWRRRFF